MWTYITYTRPVLTHCATRRASARRVRPHLAPIQLRSHPDSFPFSHLLFHSQRTFNTLSIRTYSDGKKHKVLNNNIQCAASECLLMLPSRFIYKLICQFKADDFFPLNSFSGAKDNLNRKELYFFRYLILLNHSACFAMTSYMKL